MKAVITYFRSLLTTGTSKLDNNSVGNHAIIIEADDYDTLSKKALSIAAQLGTSERNKHIMLVIDGGTHNDVIMEIKV
jgi:hypothetical protein